MRVASCERMGKENMGLLSMSACLVFLFCQIKFLCVFIDCSHLSNARADIKIDMLAFKLRACLAVFPSDRITCSEIKIDSRLLQEYETLLFEMSFPY